MPVKRRVDKRRANDFDAWDCTLRCGLDFFGDLPAAEREPGDRCMPRLGAARLAWDRHGARIVVEAAVNAEAERSAPWALWAFGPPPGADWEALDECLALMRQDWDRTPGWDDREQAENWRQDHRQQLRDAAHFAGTVPAWVAEHFVDVERAGDR